MIFLANDATNIIAEKKSFLLTLINNHGTGNQEKTFLAYWYRSYHQTPEGNQ